MVKNLKWARWAVTQILFWCSPILPIVVLADTPKDSLSELLSLSLEELTDAEIAVTSGHQQSLERIPSSVSVFTRNDIRAMGVNNVEQLLNYVPGFQVTRDFSTGGGFSVNARGSSTTQPSPNILFLIDGQRLNTELSGGALEFNHRIPLFNVKQVEVVRGPGTARYGANTFEGVVNIITDKTRREAAAYRNTLEANEFYVNTQITHRKSKLSFAGRFYDDKGDSLDDLGNHLTSVANTTLNDPRSDSDLYFDYKWRNSFAVMVRSSLSNEQLVSNDIIRSRRIDSEQEQDSITFKYLPTKSKNSQIELSGGYVAAERRYRDFTTNVSQAFLNDLTRAKERSLNFAINGRYRFAKNHRIQFGYDFRKTEEFELLNFSNNTPLTLTTQAGLNANQQYRVHGLYVEDAYRLKKPLLLTIGARLDDYARFDSELSPRGALIYKTNSAGIFKLIYNDAFRAPALRELRSTISGNTNLKGESSKTTELVWIKNFGTLFSSISYYQNKNSNLIYAAPMQQAPSTPPRRVFSNLSDSETSGVELEFSAQLKNLTFKSGYSKIDSDQEPRFTAEQSFSLIVNYQKRPWNINLHGFYHDQMQQQILLPSNNIGISTFDDYWLWNVAFHHTPPRNKWAITGRIENLFDKDYLSPSQLLYAQNGIPNRGRVVWAGLKIRL